MYSGKIADMFAMGFCSVTQSCPTLCDPMDCSTSGFPVHHQPLEFTQTCPSSQWCHPTISSSVIPLSSCHQSFPGSGSFPMSQFFSSGGQSIWVWGLSKNQKHGQLKLNQADTMIGALLQWLGRQLLCSIIQLCFNSFL